MCDKVSVWNLECLIPLPAELPHSLHSQAFTYQPVQCAWLEHCTALSGVWQTLPLPEILFRSPQSGDRAAASLWLPCCIPFILVHKHTLAVRPSVLENKKRFPPKLRTLSEASLFPSLPPHTHKHTLSLSLLLLPSLHLSPPQY